MSQQQEIRRCNWRCPICRKRCGGVEGHETKYDLVHQCPEHYNPFNHTDIYCPATVSHKHHWNDNVDSNTTVDGNGWLSIRCKSCQHVKRLEDT